MHRLLPRPCAGSTKISKEMKGSKNTRRERRHSKLLNAVCVIDERKKNASKSNPVALPGGQGLSAQFLDAGVRDSGES